MNAKQLIGIGIATVTMVASSLTVQADNTLKNVNTSFINNGTYLCVSNTAANAFNYENNSNTYFWSFVVGTNILAAYGTNAAGINYPAAIVDVPILPDVQGDVNPNLSIDIVVGKTNNWPLPATMTPAAGGYNGLSTVVGTNGLSQFSTNFIPVWPVVALTTNTATFTFVPVTDDGFPMQAIVGSTPPLVLTISCTNNMVNVLHTNLTSTVIAGCTKLRLESITVSAFGAGASSGNIGMVIDAIKLGGTTP